jgi:hypothetical protein
MDDAERTTEGVSRLAPGQRALVRACVEAAVRGPYLSDDDEFHSLMGATREEAAEVVAAWPQPAPNGLSYVTINNALNNLLGYPHHQWRRLRQEIDADEEAVAQALMTWRDEDRREGGGQGYFDALM